MFGQLLAPTIGTAVRRAVSDAFAAIMQRLNAVLDHSLSLHGLAWRLEARRTGRPLSEIVLAHTLLYRVEWVVLIHSETSLVLEQVTLSEAPAKAPDQVSAMLQAVGSFVTEAFRVTRRETIGTAAELDARLRPMMGSVPCVVVLNKADLAASWDVEHQQLEPFLRCASGVVETSARNGAGVMEAFDLLVDAMLSRMRP